MATLAGEAAVRIVPVLSNFHSEVNRGLKRQPHSLEVKLDPKFAEADAQIAAWRARQQHNDVSIPIRGDHKHLQNDISKAEHVLRRSSLWRAARINLVVIGLDALPALAYAAGSAASGLDALGKSAYALPGLLGGALSAAAALATGLNGVSDALKAYNTDSKNAHENAKKQQDADRDLTSAKRNLQTAIRDQKREIEDLNAEMRRSSLNEADAVLSIQEDIDRLRKGGFKSITELQRAQLSLAQDLDHLSEVRKKNTRTIEDANQANREGIEGSDRVADALDRVAKATEALDESKITKVSEALGKLSPNAQSAVKEVHDLTEAFKTLVQAPVQDSLFAGMDSQIRNLHSMLPGLSTGLSGVAKGLNSDIKGILDALPQNQGLLDRLFGNTQGGLTNASRGMDSFVHSFMQLEAGSSSILPRLGEAFDRVFARFDSFITKASADGSLNKWLDQGLKAVDNLGNSLINAGSIISSIGRAFDTASGTQGGFLGSLERMTDKWKDFLNTTKGQSTLIEYFRQAKDFVTGIKDAFRDMKPFIHDVMEASRNWSGGMLEVVGILAKAAGWIERNTGLLQPLLGAYLTFKTVTPIVQGLNHAWERYSQLMGGVANNGGVVDATRSKYDALKTSMANLGGASTTAANGATNVASSHDRGRTALQNYQIATGAANTASIKGADALHAYQSAVKDAVGPTGTLAATAGKAAGGIAGGGSTSLLGAAKGLMGFIGPGLAFTAAIATVTTLITKLGEAHETAGQQARDEAAALDQLKGSLDRVTGSATTATIADTAKGFESFTIPGVGKVNLNQLAKDSGVNPTDLARAAGDPTAQGVRTELHNKLLNAAKAKIEADPSYRKFASAFNEAGITSDKIALAVMGDPGALAEYRAFMEKTDAALTLPNGQHFFGTGVLADIGRALKGGGKVPTLTDWMNVTGSAGRVGFGLDEAARSQGAESRAIANSTEIAGGIGHLTPEGMGKFGAYAPEDRIRRDPSTQRGVLRLNKAPSEAELSELAKGGIEVGSPLPGGGVLVSIPKDSNLMKFAGGGLVGGIGGPTDDLNLVRTSPGEHITRAKAVDHYGVQLFDDLNNMRIPRRGIGGFLNGPEPGIPHPLAPGAHTFTPPRVRPPDVPVLGPAPTIPTLPTPSSPAPSRGLFDAVWGAPQSPLPAFRSPSQAFPPGSTVPGIDWNDYTARQPRPKATPPGPPAWLRRAGDWWKTNVSHSPVIVTETHPNDTPEAYALRKAEKERRLDPVHGGKRLLPPAASSWAPAKTPPPPPPRPATPAPGTNPWPAQTPGGITSPDGKVWREGPNGKMEWLPPVGTGKVTPSNPSVQGPSRAPSAPGPVQSPPSSVYQPTGPTVQVNGVPAPVVAGMPGGLPLAPGRFAGVERGLQVNTIAALRAIEAAFPEITDIGGVRADRLKWHPEGLALDIMIPGQGGLNDPTTPEGLALGNRIWAWMGQHAAELGIDMGASLWQQPDHHNHIHLATTGGGYPTGSEQYLSVGNDGAGLPGLAGIGGQGGAAILSALGMGGGKGGGKDLASMIANRYQEAYKPENIMKFFGSQAQNVGSSLSGIGMGLFSGLTGLNFSSLLGAGQSIGNNFLSDSDDTGSAGDSALNDIAAADISSYLTGSGLPTLSGASASGSPGKGGAEAWRPTVRKILQQIGPQFGITNIKAWEDALVKQINTESGGNPHAFNGQDSNGRGGTQAVSGILQFLPSTFAAHNITGGNLNDPTAQIAAAIPYVVKKYGMNPDGSPKWIGEGHGFAAGGYPTGLAWLSRGEYRTNPAAVEHYGPGLFTALNDMSVPKFDKGGWVDGKPKKKKGYSLWDGLRDAGKSFLTTPTTLPGTAYNLYQDWDTFTNWGKHSGLDQSLAVADAAGLIPGAGLIGKGAATFGKIGARTAKLGATLGTVLRSGPGRAGQAGVQAGTGWWQQAQHKASGGFIPRFARGGFIPRFDDGGFPGLGGVIPNPLKELQPNGQTTGPLPLGQISAPPSPTGGAPGPGASAPAPDPGVLPQVADAMAGLEVGGMGGKVAQPGVQGGGDGGEEDPRATLGAAPASLEHTSPAISGAIQGAASTIGSIASTAASLAINGVAPGAGGAAGAGIQAGAQMAGQIASGAVNILSSLLVGTATAGSTSSASGVPLLPRRGDMQSGVPVINQRVHQGDIHLTDMDAYRRTTERMDAQAVMPQIGRYS